MPVSTVSSVTWWSLHKVCSEIFLCCSVKFSMLLSNIFYIPLWRFISVLCCSIIIIIVGGVWMVAWQPRWSPERLPQGQELGHCWHFDRLVLYCWVHHVFYHPRCLLTWRLLMSEICFSKLLLWLNFDVHSVRVCSSRKLKALKCKPSAHCDAHA